jgi:succinyl-diaminopimelate desuccinylase
VSLVKTYFEDWATAHKEEIIAGTQAVLRIPSVKDETTVAPGAPFGKACADALTHTLALCEQMGMRVTNFNGYVGHAEFGPEDAPEYVAMLGHLDVVPIGSDWTFDPWGATISEGKIFSRGTSDDKGPTFAALFGAKALLDSGKPLTHRVRLIFGCDEESGWECMTHYFGPAAQPMPKLAFTPDAYFPLVYAEKGSFTIVATRDLPPNSNIASFQSGLRPNMVPDRAVVTLKDGAEIAKRGKAAHASTPDEGINAAVLLAQELLSTCPNDATWLADLVRRAKTDGSENAVGVSDDITGPLTSNLGIVQCDGATVALTFNIRYPATLLGADLTDAMLASLTETGWSGTITNTMEPLYVPQDQEPVKSLLRVYREHTGDMQPPITMGGRTYATAVAPVGVAFGTVVPGEPELAHQADENIPINRLLQCVAIYGHALYEMAK